MTFEKSSAFKNYFGSGQLGSRNKRYQIVNIPVMYLRLMHWFECKYLVLNNTRDTGCKWGERVCISLMLVDALLTDCCLRIKGHNPDGHLIASWIGGVCTSSHKRYPQEHLPSEMRIGHSLTHLCVETAHVKLSLLWESVATCSITYSKHWHYQVIQGEETLSKILHTTSFCTPKRMRRLGQLNRRIRVKIIAINICAFSSIHC